MTGQVINVSWDTDGFWFMVRFPIRRTETPKYYHIDEILSIKGSLITLKPNDSMFRDDWMELSTEEMFHTTEIVHG